jgi:hypothetical protein
MITGAPGEPLPLLLPLPLPLPDMPPLPDMLPDDAATIAAKVFDEAK